MKSQIKLPVTKFDAVRRQLETAIRLWFHSADPVSIHTLTAAAHQVLHDLNQKSGGRPSMRDAEAHVKPEFQARYRKTVSESENFFKHADHDSEATHFFKPEATPFFIFDAILIYQDLTGENVPVFRVFSSWMILQFPEILKEEHKNIFVGSGLPFRQVQQMQKAEYFALALPFAMKPFSVQS